MKKRGQIRNILGVHFLVGDVDTLLDAVLKGGQLVAPSGPGMADDLDAATYAAALRSAEVAITDSGFMVLCWWLLKGEWLKRVSGLELMERLLERESARLSRSGFWVMPRDEDQAALMSYLKCREITCRPEQCYVAPLYERGNPTDVVLVEQLEAAHPEVIVVCVGGGVQESLGAYLKSKLSYRPAIICIGAAIAFLTGTQVEIPKWADRLFLGWLFRLVSSPKSYGDRYYKAFRLIWKIHRFEANSGD